MESHVDVKMTIHAFCHDKNDAKIYGRPKSQHLHDVSHIIMCFPFVLPKSGEKKHKTQKEKEKKEKTGNKKKQCSKSAQKALPFFWRGSQRAAEVEGNE